MKDLEDSRRRQFQDKKTKIANEAKDDRDFAMKNLQIQKQIEDQERKLALQKRSEIAEHSEKLKGQI